MLEEAGHAPPPDAEPTLAETRAAFEAIRQASGAAREGPAARGPVRPVGSAHGRGDREGALGRAPDRAPRGPARGGAREGVRPAARCREARGDAHRRHRPDRDARPRRPARRRADDPVPPAQVHARVARPRTRPRSSGGSGPTVWVEDKYDGIRAQLHRRGDDVRLYSRDLHDISGQFPEVVEGARGPAVGRDPRRRDPRLEGRRRAAVPPAPGAAGAQEPVGEDPRRDPGDLRRLGRAGHGPRRGHGGHAGARGAADGAPPAARDAGAAARRGGRPVRAQPPRVGGLGRRAGGGVRRGPGAAQRGPDGQGPDERLLARPARAGLAEDEEGAGDDRLRRRRRGGRPRQAPRRASATTRSPCATRRAGSWSRSARRTPG